MELTDPHLFREPPRQRIARVAACIEAAPEACFAIALENLERWQKHGRLHPGPLIEWRQRIHEAQSSAQALLAFLQFLRSSDPDECLLLSCSPFVGLPTTVS